MEPQAINATPPRPKTVRGLSLLSGGLDSQLAICVLRAQGIDMEALVFNSPFFAVDAARQAAAALGVRLHEVDFTTDILELVKHPPHGFGSCMNPCLDCHARMLQRAGELRLAEGFDFVSTGEVLGQRPMSQHRRGLAQVAKASGIGEYLLRPLSALRLEPSPMELDGRIDRSRLLGLEGRSRRPQMALAREYGVVDYPSPAGGCKLTEPNYSRRLKDMRDRGELDDRAWIELLRLGRHVRLPDGGRAVVGRNRADNEAIRAAAGPHDLILRTVDVPGPTVLQRAGASAADMDLARRICAAYAKACSTATVRVRTHFADRPPQDDEVEPLDRECFAGWLL